MGAIFKKNIDQNFFKRWSHEMSYVLGYIVADGCISFSKDRKKHPYFLNITSADREHLSKIRKVIGSEHKIGIKPSGQLRGYAFQLQIRNPVITQDLINLGIFPRKTYTLRSVKVSKRYFPDFVRGFFDGDGSVYIYNVNNTPQIKASFVNSSLPFISCLNQQLCTALGIPLKTIQKSKGVGKNLPLYSICFYIEDCKKLTKFMYRGGPNIYLERKYKVFNQWRSIKRRHYIKRNYPSKVGWSLNRKYYAEKKA